MSMMLASCLNKLSNQSTKVNANSEPNETKATSTLMHHHAEVLARSIDRDEAETDIEACRRL